MVKQWKRSLSGADVQAEAEDALEKDISNLSPASNSVAGVLDGGLAGGGGIDWSTKSPNFAAGSISSGNTLMNISGSGYLIGITANIQNNLQSFLDINVVIDGGGSGGVNFTGFAASFNTGSSNNTGLSASLFHRFDNSLKINNNDSSNISMGAIYVLD